MPQLTVQIILENAEFDTFVIILGIIWSMIVGGLYAFAYVLILDYTGKNNMLLKAVAVVSGIWLTVASPTMQLFNLFPEARQEPLPVAAFFCCPYSVCCSSQIFS